VGRAGVILLRLTLPIFFLIASVTTVNAQDAKAKCPPVARIEDVAETIHGTVVHDPYRWLEEQDSPETRAWIDAENACTQAVLSKVPGQDAIARRLGELIKVDTIGLPIEREPGFVCPLYAARGEGRGGSAGGSGEAERGSHDQREFRRNF
jgi:hypothetical protein